MKNINIIIPYNVIRYKNEYYSTMPSVLNELTKYFYITIYCKVTTKNKINRNKYLKYNNKINFINFFEEVTLYHFILNIIKYNKKLHEIKKNETLFMIDYPYRIISMFIGFFLKEKQLIIRVINEPMDQFIIHGNTLTKPLRLILKPLFSLIYKLISTLIFKNNLILYSGKITINKKNHINQIELHSNSPFNVDKHLIVKKINNKIFFVGNESKRKGLTVLLKSLQNTTYELNIIGIDQVKNKKNLKLIKNVNTKFHGPVYERKKFYTKLSQGDILVMPSYGEKQGKVVLEAMSVGVVPISSDAGGMSFLISNYYNGLFFKEGNHKSLRQMILLLYHKKEIYENIKANGIEYVNNLSVKKQAKNMSNIIKNYYIR